MDANRYNYLFDLLTGKSAYTNSAGNSDWAREQLISAFLNSKEAEYTAMYAMGMAGGIGWGNKSTTSKIAKDFEKSIVKLSPAERVATVKSKAQEIAKNVGLVKDSKLSKINGRDVYKDPKTGDLYSVDTQHGRFEKTNSKGKHLGEVDFDFKSTKPADPSGNHNLKVK